MVLITSSMSASILICLCCSLDLSGEFMIFNFRLHQELAAKQKPPDHQGRRFCHFLRRRFHSASFLTAHPRELFVPALGTVALHCPVARLVSESFLMSPNPSCAARSAQ